MDGGIHRQARLVSVFGLAGSSLKLRMLVVLGCLAVAGCAGGTAGSGGSGGGPNEVGDVFSLQLFWEAPLSNTDGSPLQDLAGFKVYDSTTSGQYSSVTDVGNTTSFTLDSLPAGTYYIVVTAYDTAGHESEFSNELAVTLP